MSIFSFNDLAIARAVIQQQIEGLTQICNTLDHSFIQAVEQCASVKGRIVISGMGKSGHIARKIVATLSSTGSPALFVHPAEASHGDLGMITKDDVLILLSNSGETTELNLLISYSRRSSIPLIAIVGKTDSHLAHHSDIILALPEIPEAAKVNAPTTSTTMMLVLGDALAVALMERKGFTNEHFRLLHPGGKIGAALTRVSDIMHKGKEFPFVYPDTSMENVLLEMTTKRLGCSCVVTKDNILVGMITDGDLRRHMHPKLLDKRAEDIMTVSPATITPDEFIATALLYMETRSITHLCVINTENSPLGLLHIHDCLRLRAL